ncbi:MAG: lipopolysaccharide biosynthesis protein, partial [Proteobacteria bacterium]|nr:lipopolysaccharide biosynthesis protein [Pseudomonadota bacterium]
GAQRAAEFRRHLFANLLDSPGYVANLFDLLAREPMIGVLMPTVVQVGYPTLGHAWFGNRARVQALADELGLRAVLDESTPLAPLGSMYWFRPGALAPLFSKAWRWQDFEGESYGDGDLPHALERLLPYCAQARGYLVWCALTVRSAARNYVKLEYRHQALSACFPEADTRGQITTVRGYRDDPRPFKVRGAANELNAALRRSLRFRIDKLRGKRP